VQFGPGGQNLATAGSNSQLRHSVSPYRHLCRYLLRPLIAQERWWHDGTRAIRFEPAELLEKLASIIPKSRTNLLVYHRVFAPHARLLPEAVRWAQERVRHTGSLPGGTGDVGGAATAASRLYAAEALCVG